MRSDIDIPIDITDAGPAPDWADGYCTKPESFPVTVRVLKPLTSSEDLMRAEASAKTNRKARRTRRALSIGGGSLAVVVIIALSGLFFVMPDPASGILDVSNTSPNDRQAKRSPRPPKEPGTFLPFPFRDDSNLSAEVSPPYEVVNDVVKSVRSTPRRILSAVYKPRTRAHRPALVISKFVPTTLIIYPENGVIKSRLEPQLAAVFKK
jgi:hypothetical protein